SSCSAPRARRSRSCRCRSPTSRARRSASGARSGGATTGRRPTCASPRARKSTSQRQRPRDMPLIKVKPTSPGRRAFVKAVTPDLHKGAPFWPLTARQSKTTGRNNAGRITMRHKGGGHKQHYRVIDFRRDKDGIAAKVERLDYDPNRSAHLALLLYADGERRYIIAPKGLAAGTQLQSGSEAPIKPGNALPLRNIPVGTMVHCVEMLPGKGAQLARSAGASAQLLAREGSYAQLRLRSGEIRKVHVDCRATIGEGGNEEHKPQSIGKAGRPRRPRHPPPAT